MALHIYVTLGDTASLHCFPATDYHADIEILPSALDATIVKFQPPTNADGSRPATQEITLGELRKMLTERVPA